VSDATTTAPERPFFGQPFGWLVLAVALAHGAAGARRWSTTGWTVGAPAPRGQRGAERNSSAVFLIAGGIAIKQRKLAFHRQAMLAAVSCSAVFLASYLVRFATTGAHRYPGHGAAKTFYLVLLGSHTVLAAVALPLVLRTLWLALKGRFDRHPKLARIAYPIWLYVSLTGVLVYVMLYHLA
jgi:putative membrane protein